MWILLPMTRYNIILLCGKYLNFCKKKFVDKEKMDEIGNIFLYTWLKNPCSDGKDTNCYYTVKSNRDLDGQMNNSLVFGTGFHSW